MATTINSQDVLQLNLAEDSSGLLNVHTAIRSPNRKLYGKLTVTYSNPLAETEKEFTASSEANGTPAIYASDGFADDGVKYFTLYENDLSGAYAPSDETSHLAWAGSDISDASGSFAQPQTLTIHFTTLILQSLTVTGDTAHNNFPVDFVVTVTKSTGAQTIYTIVGNTEMTRTIFTIPKVDIVDVSISITKISQPGLPASISEVPILSTHTYTDQDLLSINLVEELSYEDAARALGGISANELTAYIDNSSGEFYFGDDFTAINTQLKKNRKVVAWLGVVVGTITEWYCLGTFWSYSWLIPPDQLSVKVVAFDTIGFLDNEVFYRHQVYLDYSLGALFELVLTSAKAIYDFIEFEIDPLLYNVTIPVAWFENASYMQALIRLANCYPVNVYCDRSGKILVKKYTAPSESWRAAWSRSDTITTLSYPTMYNTLPNIVNVKVYSIGTETGSILDDTSIQVISETTEVDYNFTDPAQTVSSVSVTKTAGVSYTYEAFSWGLKMMFTGTGTVSGVSATGTKLSIKQTVTCTKRDSAAVTKDGPEPRSIDSQLVQTSEHAAFLANDILVETGKDKYNAELTYTGDISASLTDVIWLKEGLAQPNHYVIKKHSLFWAGYLTGTATLEL